MNNQKAASSTNKTHEGKNGRVFQGNEQSGQGKGHDLMNSNSSTDGVGQEIKSPGQARQRDQK